MITQQTLMYGLNRSPTLAAFQKIPTTALQSRISAEHNTGVGDCLPFLVSIHPSWEELVEVCAGADHEQ